MAELAIQEFDRTGAITLSAAASAGDTFKGVPGNIIVARNADSSTATITITAVNDPLNTVEAGSLDIPNITVVVPAVSGAVSGVKVIHVPSAYVSAGVVSMTYDSVTALTIGVGVNG